MNAEVEQRIVEMRFDNEQFKRGAQQTLSILEKLDSVLDLLGAGGAVEKLGSALETVEYRFSRLGIAGMAAIEQITHKVLGLASSILTAIPEQIISGGTQRALNIENAKFQLKGLGVAWEDVADDIDHAVMGTAYGVDEAAKAAAILAASKVDFHNAADQVSDMGVVLRSISGLAAMTNSSYDEIGNLMGDIFAMGKLSTRQLQSFELRGLNVAAKLAEVLREAGNGAQHTEEEIRDMVSKGQIDALTFAKAMDAAFGEHATAANETYTGSLRNMKAALSRIGADFVAPLHEAERLIFLDARAFFDKIRKITRPFAEGRFMENVQRIARTFGYFLHFELDTTWLEKLVGFLNKSDAWFKPIDWLISKLWILNGIIHKIFNNESLEGLTTETSSNRLWFTDVIPKTINLLKKVLAILVEITGHGWNIRAAIETISWHASLLLSRILDMANLVADKILGNSDKIENALTWIWTDVVLEAFFNLRDILDATGRLGLSVFHVFESIFKRLFKNVKWLGTYWDRGVIYKLSDSIHEFIYKSLIPAIDKITAFNEKLAEMIKNGEKLKNLEALFASFGRFGKAAFDLVIDVIQKLYNKLKDRHSAVDFCDLLDKISEKIIKVADKLTEWLIKLKEFIDGERPIGGALGRIRDSFQKVGDFADSAKTKVSNFIHELFGLKEGETLWDRFNRLVDNASGPLKSFGEAIRSTFGTDDTLGNKVAKFFGILITGFIAFRKFQKSKWAVERLGRVFDLLKGQWDGLKTLANLPDKISTVFSRLSGALRALTDNLNAKSLVEIGKAVIFMAIGIGILSLIDTNKAITAIEAMMISLMALMTALGLMTKFLKIGLSLGVVAPVLVALAASLLLIAIAIGILSLVPTEKLIFAVIAMGVALFALMMGLQELSRIMTLANPIKIIAAAIAVGLLAAAMAILAIAMLGFMLIPADKMLDAWLAMSAALLTVVVAVGMLSKLARPASMLAGAAAIIAIAGALIIIGIAVHLFKGVDLKELLPMAVALMEVVLALALLSNFANPLGMLAAGASLIMLGGALIILSIGLAALSFVISKDENALIHLAGLLIIVVVALVALSTVAPMALVASLALAVAGAALVIGAAGLLLLAVALNAFNSVKVAPDYLLSFGGALVVLGLAGIVFGLGGLGLLIGGAGLLVLAIALNMMSGVNVAPDYLLSLGGALAALGIAGVIFGLGGLGLMLGGVGLILLAKGLHAMEGFDSNVLSPDYLLALGGALAVLGIAGVALMIGAVGLGFGGEALIKFSECLSPLAEGVKAFDGVNISEIGALFGALATAILALIGLNFAAFSNVGALKDLGEALIPLAAGVKAFSEVGFLDLAKMFGSLASSLGTLLGLNFVNAGKFTSLANGMYLLAESFDKFPTDASSRLRDVVSAIKNTKQDAVDAMNELLSGVTEAIINNEVPVANAMNSLLSAIANAANSSENMTIWHTIGGNITIGIANGIISRTQEAANAMRRLATALQTSFTVSLQIRSPSRVFENLAGFIPAGISRGIQNGEPQVTSAMANCMSGAMSLMDQYANATPDMTPRVTPVMDMAGMRRDVGYADKLFQNSRLNDYVGINGLTVHGDAISYNMQNKDVVNEVKQMSAQIARLGEAITNMQMVLDTGVLVGNIGRAMNSELGAIAVREKRQ